VIRVPLFLKPPADNRFGNVQQRVDEPVSLLDIAPTILDIAGISTDARLDGISFFETLQNKKRPEDRPILFEIWNHVIPNPAIGMVFAAADGNRYMFTFNASDDLDELYLLDREKKLRNLIYEKSKSAILQEAIEKMDEFLERDRRWFGYSNFFKLDYAEKLGKPSGDRQWFL
jgi:hypothetical protein